MSNDIIENLRNEKENTYIIEKKENLRILNDMKKCVIEYENLYNEIQTKITKKENKLKELEETSSELYDEKGKTIFPFIGFIFGDIVSIFTGNKEAISSGIKLFKEICESSAKGELYFNRIKDLLFNSEYTGFIIAIIFSLIGYFAGHSLYEFIMRFIDERKSSKNSYVKFYLEPHLKEFDFQKNEFQNILANFWNKAENNKFQNIIPLEDMSIIVVEKLIYIIEMDKANNINDALKILKSMKN